MTEYVKNGSRLQGSGAWYRVVVRTELCTMEGSKEVLSMQDGWMDGSQHSWHFVEKCYLILCLPSRLMMPRGQGLWLLCPLKPAFQGARH